MKEAALKKGVLKSFHSHSLSNSRRNLSTSKRKTFKNSLSLHNKLPSPQKKDQPTSSFRRKKYVVKPIGEKILNKS